MKKPVLFLFILFLLALTGGQVQAEMSGSSYKINWDSINAGGGEDLSGSSYHMYSTVSEVGPGASSGSTYNLDAGYQQWIENLGISMIVEAQATSPETTYSAFSNSGLNVSIASSAGFSVDDYILVVENEGTGQMVAVGKIESIVGSGPYTVTVDKWSGDQASMSATPSGGDDKIYELNGHAVNMGFFSTGSVKTAVSIVELTIDRSGGYTCTVEEDGDFSNGTDEIDDVSDGSVTASNEEYGIEKTGDDVVGSGSDVAITGTASNIMNAIEDVLESRTAVIYKAAIDANTSGGHYEHTAIYKCTGNF